MVNKQYFYDLLVELIAFYVLSTCSPFSYVLDILYFYSNLNKLSFDVLSILKLIIYVHICCGMTEKELNK